MPPASMVRDSPNSSCISTRVVSHAIVPMSGPPRNRLTERRPASRRAATGPQTGRKRPPPRRYSCPIPRRAAHRALAAAVAVTAIVASPADAAASGPTRLAARLARLDPGGRTGANTVIGTARNQGLFGVPRPDIIVALGAGETISGGAGGDQLGALADHVTIRGGGGRDTVYGGRRGTLVGGTSDLLADTTDDAT